MHGQNITKNKVHQQFNMNSCTCETIRPDAKRESLFPPLTMFGAIAGGGENCKFPHEIKKFLKATSMSARNLTYSV